MKQIENDLKEAMKSKDAFKLSTLRLLKAALMNAKIAKKEELKEEEVASIIKKQIKQRKDSIEEFKKGERCDLVEKERNELNILKNYLPEDLAPEQILSAVKEAIAQTQASSMKDMGNVIKEVMANTQGRADGKTVSEFVKKELLGNAQEPKDEDPADK
ncbi:GatB/YqeY domain-containing protein [Candidatus Omnitrophota bacterium]